MLKVDYALYGKPILELRTERHLPCGITQCYLPPDIEKRLKCSFLLIVPSSLIIDILKKAFL